MPGWIGRLLGAQALISLVAAIVYFGGDSQSLWYAVTVGMIPVAIVIAYVFRLPHSKFMLLTYCAFTVALGGLVLLATVVESAGGGESWITPSRLILGVQVAVGALLLGTLSNARHWWEHRT